MSVKPRDDLMAAQTVAVKQMTMRRFPDDAPEY